MTDRITSKLIRLQCDGELTAEQAEQVRQCLESHPEDRAGFEDQLKGEQRLRECVRSAMLSSGKCPAALRELISAAITEARPAEAGVAPAEAARRWNDASLIFSPRRANIFAIAATLLVIAGAILYGIFGTSIDDVRDTPADLVANAAIVASRTHESSAANDRTRAGDAKLVRQAELDLSEWLNAPTAVFDLSDLEYEFVGATQANLPLSGPSARMIYRSTKSGERKPRVSVYVARMNEKDRDECQRVKPGEWHETGEGKCKHKVMYCYERKLMFFVVCCNERDLPAVLDKVKLAKN